MNVLWGSEASIKKKSRTEKGKDGERKREPGKKEVGLEKENSQSRTPNTQENNIR